MQFKVQLKQKGMSVNNNEMWEDCVWGMLDQDMQTFKGGMAALAEARAFSKRVAENTGAKENIYRLIAIAE